MVERFVMRFDVKAGHSMTGMQGHRQSWRTGHHDVETPSDNRGDYALCRCKRTSRNTIAWLCSSSLAP